MGNRAVITFSQDANSPCIYLHWNGGRASVEAFLQAARYLGLRNCPQAGYGLAGKHAEAMVLDDLAQMIARHFFRGAVGYTVYRELYGRADKKNGDNGVYVLNHDMTIGDRLFVKGSHGDWMRLGEEIDATKTREIFEYIVQRAPVFND